MKVLAGIKCINRWYATFMNIPRLYYPKSPYMQYLNKEIEKLAKKKAGNSLVKKQYSCGIFKDLEVNAVLTEQNRDSEA